MRRVLTVTGWMLAGTMMCGVAVADDRAAAQSLFQQGKTLLAAGKTAEACPKFEAAAKLSQTAGVRLNLADCWALLGRTASAWTTYEDARTVAERANDGAAAEQARAGRTAMEAKLVYLTVTVPKENAVLGMKIERDGETVPEALWGTAIPVDPGTHVIKVSGEGLTPWDTTRELKTERERVVVTIPNLRVATVAAGAASSAAPAASSPDKTTEPASPAGGVPLSAIVTGGVGLVGLGVGTAFGLIAKSKKSDYVSHENPTGQCADADCATLSQSAHSAGNVATVAFVVGGALVATGVVLWVMAPASGDAKAGMFVAPSVGVRDAGVVLGGGW